MKHEIMAHVNNSISTCPSLFPRFSLPFVPFPLAPLLLITSAIVRSFQRDYYKRYKYVSIRNPTAQLNSALIAQEVLKALQHTLKAMKDEIMGDDNNSISTSPSLSPRFSLPFVPFPPCPPLLISSAIVRSFKRDYYKRYKYVSIRNPTAQLSFNRSRGPQGPPTHSESHER